MKDSIPRILETTVCVLSCEEYWKNIRYNEKTVEKRGMEMQINQKLYDKYGSVLTVKSVLGNKYTGILMKCSWFSTAQGLKKSAPTATSVSFTDEDMGVIYFFEKEDIGNRSVLLNPNGLYAKNRSNIEAQFKNYMVSIRSSLPYGTIMFGEDKQDIINSFFDEVERKKEKEFIDSHSMCFARMDLESCDYCAKY